MLPAHRVLDDIIASLRTVIGPAVADPYPRAQAYMAAVILEFVSRHVEERSDLDAEKARALESLFQDLGSVLGGHALPGTDEGDAESRLCRVIEWLYAEREQLGLDVFAAANGRVRQALRQLLDADLQISGQPRD